MAAAVQRFRGNVLVCRVAQADEALFNVTRWVAAHAPCAVLVLTDSLNPGSIAASAAAGVHTYVADGYLAHRLPALVLLAQSRFKHEASLIKAIADAKNQLDERKVVDHAKTILMRARQLSDDDAFRMLRTASMHSNQRLADVSGQVIAAARFADGVNRAGQLRMLSQRLVLLQAVQLLRPGQAPKTALKSAVERIDDNLTVLAQNFAQPDMAVLIKQADTTWHELKRKLKKPTSASDMAVVDSLAETLLAQAEDLTRQLQNAGSTMTLQVLNVAGRQRMLSQRVAKFALLQALGLASGLDAAVHARQEFEKALHYLHNIPLTTPQISQLLASAQLGWRRLLTGAEAANHAADQPEIESASQALLAVFEQLSSTYESSMQMLMG